MCVTSHHFPPWQANRPATPNMKNIHFTTCFFIPPKACDGHPGRRCDTDGWVGASFPWVKYQALSDLSTHPHTITPTDTQTQTMLGSLCDAHVSRCVFFMTFFECQMDAMAHDKKESIRIHTCDTRGGLFASLGLVSGGLLLGWPGPRADAEKWQHLACSRVILFSVGTVSRHSVG